MESIKEQTPPDDHLDRVLDAALAKYASVEARAGLEDRVLANLRVESLRPSRHPWLRWGLAGAVAVLAIIAVVAWRSSRTPHPVIANYPPVTIQRPSTQDAKLAPNATHEVGAIKHASMRKPAARRMRASTAVATYPKLDQFPSPQPLSVQEMTLAQYVRNFPKEAQLVAQSQEAFDLETQKVMNHAGSETRTSSPIEQER